MSEADQEALDDEATRVGSRALFYNSLLSLVATFVMPMFIRNEGGAERNIILRILSRLNIHLCDLWSFSHLLFAICMASTL